MTTNSGNTVDKDQAAIAAIKEASKRNVLTRLQEYLGLDDLSAISKIKSSKNPQFITIEHASGKMSHISMVSLYSEEERSNFGKFKDEHLKRQAHKAVRDVSKVPVLTEEVTLKSKTETPQSKLSAFVQKVWPWKTSAPIALHERIEPFLSRPVGPAEEQLPAIFRSGRKTPEPAEPEAGLSPEENIPNIDVSEGWKKYLEKREAIDAKVKAAADARKTDGSKTLTGIFQKIRKWWQKRQRDKENELLTQKLRDALEESYRNGSRQRPISEQPNNGQENPTVTTPEPDNSANPQENPEEPQRLDSNDDQPPEENRAPQPPPEGRDKDKDNNAATMEEQPPADNAEHDNADPASPSEGPQQTATQNNTNSRPQQTTATAQPPAAPAAGERVVHIHVGGSINNSNINITPDIFNNPAQDKGTTAADSSTPPANTPGKVTQLRPKPQQRRLPEPPKPSALARGQYAPALGAAFLKSARINPYAIKGVTEINDENKLVFELKDGQAITIPVDAAQNSFDNTRDLAVGINRALDIINRHSAKTEPSTHNMSEEEMWAKREEFLPAAA